MGSFPHDYPQLWRDRGDLVNACKQGCFASDLDAAMLAVGFTRERLAAGWSTKSS
jgi:hypothetical protein